MKSKFAPLSIFDQLKSNQFILCHLGSKKMGRNKKKAMKMKITKHFKLKVQIPFDSGTHSNSFIEPQIENNEISIILYFSFDGKSGCVSELWRNKRNIKAHERAHTQKHSVHALPFVQTGWLNHFKTVHYNSCFFFRSLELTFLLWTRFIHKKRTFFLFWSWVGSSVEAVSSCDCADKFLTKKKIT